jgi:hypothetical protein
MSANVDQDPEKHISLEAGHDDMDEHTALVKKVDPPPDDKHNMAYYIFFLLGIGLLLPWNAFITASAYYRSRLCGTDYFVNFESYLSVAFSLSSEMSLIFVVLLRYTAILYPLYIFVAMIMLNSGFVLFPHIDGDNFFMITMTSITVVGIVGSMVRSGIFMLAGKCRVWTNHACVVFPPLAAAVAATVATSSASQNSYTHTHTSNRILPTKVHSSCNGWHQFWWLVCLYTAYHHYHRFPRR